MKLIKATTSDQLQFTGILEEAPSAKNIIIHIHGTAGDIYSNSYYPAMYHGFPQNDWSFLAVEHRGTHSITEFKKGTSVINIGNAYEIFEDCILDIDAWVKRTKELGYINIWLQSHSFGPSKVAYYMYKRKSEDIKGLIFISPADMIGLVHDPIGQKDHGILFPEAKKLVAENKGDQLLNNLLWGAVKLSARSYINMYGDDANTNIFHYGKPELPWTVVNNIKVPVIAFTGTDDDGIEPVIDPHIGMKMLEKELIHAPRKKTIVYDGADHDFSGFGGQMVTDILEFISG